MDIFWNKKGTLQKVHHSHLRNSLPQIFREHDKVWVDMPRFGKDEEELLRVYFNIHPLTIEDCSKVSSRPKIEEFDTYLYVVLYGLDVQGHFTQLNFIIGQDYLITVQHRQIASYEALKRDDGKIQALLGRDTEFVMHYLMDIEIDKYFPILEHIDDQMEKLEERVTHETGNGPVHEIFHLKHQLLTLKHHIAPQKEILFALSRKGNKFMMPASTDYFRDIYDHTVRALDDIENYREILNGILDVHFSVTSNHLNDVIKVLTVFSTIFLPLTLIASIYGMNFEHMPELTWKYGYFIILGVMLLIAIIMWLFFKKRHWA